MKKSIFAHFIIALNYIIKNTLVKAGFLLSWDSAEMGFLDLASVGLLAKSPWGLLEACPGVKTLGKLVWGQYVALFWTEAQLQLLGGKGCSLAFICYCCVVQSIVEACLLPQPSLPA